MMDDCPSPVVGPVRRIVLDPDVLFVRALVLFVVILALRVRVVRGFLVYVRLHLFVRVVHPFPVVHRQSFRKAVPAGAEDRRGPRPAITGVVERKVPWSPGRVGRKVPWSRAHRGQKNRPALKVGVVNYEAAGPV